MSYRDSHSKMVARMQAGRPSRKAIQAAIDAHRPLDQAKPEPVKRKPARKLTDDDLPEWE